MSTELDLSIGLRIHAHALCLHLLLVSRVAILNLLQNVCSVVGFVASLRLDRSSCHQLNVLLLNYRDVVVFKSSGRNVKVWDVKLRSFFAFFFT